MDEILSLELSKRYEVLGQERQQLQERDTPRFL